ncbi:MAG: HAD family phosphatase [Caldilineales bacterium]|nr:HAD family phosphatase [Caldilineales bacterium]
MGIQAIIFDFGGVLVHFDGKPGQAAWEQRLGLQPGRLDRLVFHSEVCWQAVLGRVPEQAIWDEIAARFELNAADLARLQQDFWLGEYRDEAMIDLMRELRSGYKIGILSNAWSEARATFASKFGLDQEVDLMVISAEEGIAKPDAEIYQRTLDRLGVNPNQAIFIDDLPENIRGAQVLGMHAIQFQTTAQTISEIRRLLAQGD